MGTAKTRTLGIRVSQAVFEEVEAEARRMSKAAGIEVPVTTAARALLELGIQAAKRRRKK